MHIGRLFEITTPLRPTSSWLLISSSCIQSIAVSRTSTNIKLSVTAQFISIIPVCLQEVIQWSGLFDGFLWQYNCYRIHSSQLTSYFSPRHKCRFSHHQPKAIYIFQYPGDSAVLTSVLSYVMTSALTSGCLDRVSVWIVWMHYVKIWSNSDKNWRRTSIMKGVTSRLWGHRVTWRHCWRHHWIARGHFPIVTYPLVPLVSEIFDLKVVDPHTYIVHTNRFPRWVTKGRLKLSAHEPTAAIHICLLYSCTQGWVFCQDSGKNW